MYVKWKGYDHSFNSWIDKKDILLKLTNTFLNHSEMLEEVLMLKLICLIMQRKQIWKKISHVDTSNFELKSNLASLKTEVDKFDIDKLVPAPVDLSKLSD